MHVVLKAMINYLENEPLVSGKDGIDAKDFAGRFTTDNVLTCAFGLDGRSFVDKEPEFLRLGREMLKTDYISNMKQLIIFFWPDLNKILRVP